jgi:hypothetical protein
LNCDGLEKEVHCGHETLLGTGATVLDQTFPVAMQASSQVCLQSEKMVSGSLSSKSRNASIALVGVGKI